MGSKSSKPGPDRQSSVSRIANENEAKHDGSEVQLEDLKEFESFNPAQYCWVNRYIHEVERLRNYSPGMFDNADVVQAIRANIRQIYDDQKFNRAFPPRFLEIENIEPRNEIIMYKLVRILDYGKVSYLGYYDFKNNHDFNLIMHTVALIELRVDVTKSAIKNGKLGGNVLAADQLIPTKKYVVEKANVAGVQFIGPAPHLNELTRKLRDGELRLVSNFDIHFVYKLGTTIEDPSFGMPGIGCVQGIHAFISKREAIKYLKTGFSGIDLFSPTITPIDLEGPDPGIEEEQLRAAMVANAKRKSSERFMRKHNEEIVIRRMMGKEEKEREQEEQNPKCDVCRFDLWKDNPIIPNCRHKLHYHCIGRQNLKNNTCPICNAALY